MIIPVIAKGRSHITRNLGPKNLIELDPSNVCLVEVYMVSVFTTE